VNKKNHMNFEKISQGLYFEGLKKEDIRWPWVKNEELLVLDYSGHLTSSRASPSLILPALFTEMTLECLPSLPGPMSTALSA
jgi:hypothetical protein